MVKHNLPELPENGTLVRFRGDTSDEISEGIVNGEPQHFEREQITYVPVHVRKGNRNLMVDSRNIVEDKS